jgi:hypothetical protein
MHPLLTLLADILSNEDFFGTEIRNADDPLVQQVATSALRHQRGDADLVQQQSVESSVRHHEGAGRA